MVYGHRRGLARSGLRDPMGSMRLMRLPHESHRACRAVAWRRADPIRSQRPARSDLLRARTPIRSPSSCPRSQNFY
jgi:hypothetical protein